MIWQILITAIGLVFVLEGILPFLSPNLWRRIMHNMMNCSNNTLHGVGLGSMLIGLLFIYIVHNFY